jgi:membrane-bound lytic murein transglycosylase D
MKALSMKHPLSLLILTLALGGCATTDGVDAQRAPRAPDPSAPAAAPPSAAEESAAIAPLPLPAEPPVVQRVEDDLNPDQPLDLQAADAQRDLWARVRAGLALADLQGPRVDKWEAYYANRPDYVQRMTERGGRYLFHIVEEVQKRQLPMELALLPFIESAFNPEAESRAKASGMWQFMSATGRDFDLKQNLFRDDRRDVLASTRAALDYLAQLGRRYDGDWPLALAAYNWGMGNVDRAIKRNAAKGLPTDYESLRMPAETADYVPKLQAVKNIVLRPEAYGLSLPALANHPYFVTVRIERDIDVELAARLADLSVDRFRQFNPQMNKPVILAAATPALLLPFDNASRFVQSLADHQGPMASWTAWQVPRTMKPAEAAKLVGMAEDELRSLNRIPPRMLVKAGSTLLVSRTAKRDHDVSEHLADTATLALAADVQRRLVKHKAVKGDTVASVARRYGVSAQQVAQWNQVGPNARFAPGTVVELQLPPARKAANRKATPPKASAQAPAKTPAKANAPRPPGPPVAKASAKPPKRG